jgi:hypothetical protein
VQVFSKYGQIRLPLGQYRINPSYAFGRHGSGGGFGTQGFPCVGDVDEGLTEQ